MAKSEINVRIPQPVSIITALKLYYEHTELSNDNIKELFGNLSGATISKLKKKVYIRMAEENTPIWNAMYVNTEVAYKTWGIDVTDLERRYHKLKELSS